MLDRGRLRKAAAADQPPAALAARPASGSGAIAPPLWSELAACLLIYMAAAAFGRWMMVLPASSITIWPPNGVILAFLLMSDRRTWPWWILVGAVGELAGNAIWFGNPILPALGYVAANASEIVVAALLLSAVLNLPLTRIRTLREVLTFLGLGVLLAPVVGGLLGAAVIAATGRPDLMANWTLWWLGDATGVLLATPLVISMHNMWREAGRLTPAQLLEAALIGASMVALAQWQFSSGMAYAFVLFVPTLWAALRFEMRGAALAALLLAVLIGLDAQGRRDTADTGDGSTYRHAMLQALMIVSASMGLIVAAVIRQYRQAVTDLSLGNATLEQRVADRTAAIEAAERRFKATFANAAVGIAIVDPEGVFVSVNDSLARMLGYPPDELEGRSLDQVTHPDSLAEGQAARARLRSGSSDMYVLEKRYLRKDGAVVWGQTSGSCVRGSRGEVEYLIKVIQDVTARRQAEDMRQLLMREVNHRSKNLLSIIQAIARQTSAKSPQDFVVAFGHRLQALAANQDLLVESGWRPIDLKDLAQRQLVFLGETLQGRIRLRGDPTLLSVRGAQALGMALHELATNAMKYGSLSNDGGLVDIAWGVSEGRFTMSWTESGGPPVTVPARNGFGATITGSMVKLELGAEVTIDYRLTGLVWHLTCPVGALQDDRRPDTGADPA